MGTTQDASPTVLLGGRVFTADRGRPWLDGVAFDRTGILAVGAEDEVGARFPEARWIDVGGRTVVPGFIDAHNHFLATGESLSSIDVRYPAVASCEDLVQAIAVAAATTPEGEWVRAFGFDHAKYDRAPTRWDLDRATSRHPVVVYHVSGHHVLVNSALLELRGVGDDTPDPAGGALVRDGGGRVTGLCLDGAMHLVLPVAVDIGNHGPNFHTQEPLAVLVDAVERAGSGVPRGRADDRLRRAGHRPGARRLPGRRRCGAAAAPHRVHAAVASARRLPCHRARRPVRRRQVCASAR